MEVNQVDAAALLQHFAYTAQAASQVSSPSDSFYLETSASYNSPQTSVYSDNDASCYSTPQDFALGTSGSQDRFLDRMSQMCYVKPALRAYEMSKNHSRVVQYMELSVQAISKPMLDKMPLDALDGFACRQLDRFQTPPVASTSTLPASADAEVEFKQIAQQPELEPHKSRAVWQNMVVHGCGLSAAVSEESMRKLQYCLQWLQYANKNLQYQISLLRSLILSLQPNADNPLPFAQQAECLQSIKAEIILTIHKAIDVVSTYAGAALPDQASSLIRNAVLSLPMKVQARSSSKGTAKGEKSSLSEAAERILAFALEGIDVLATVAKVVGDSIETAEAWLERLRTVGLSTHHSSTMKQAEEPLEKADQEKQCI